ncbi:MAG: UDP-2,3-diacylglucosamine diphosphatase LpxI [Alphaproteobacteria bacterium]
MTPNNNTKLGIFAGGGDLPLKLAEACRANGRPFFVIGIEGSAGPEIESFPHAWAGIGAIARAHKLLKDEGCGEVVFAGIVKRPDFKNIKLDHKGVRLLPKVVHAAARGDDALLTTILRDFEREGFKVVSVSDVLSDIIVRPSVLTARSPSDRDMRDIVKAIEVVRELGKLDVGQGAVVCEGLVLAVEAAEGTDAMLERCAQLPANIRGNAEARRGVLVKMPKPHQEMRVDLPTIGVPTVEKAAAAGLAGIAVKAGAALILNEAEVITRANALGIFVTGIGDA